MRYLVFPRSGARVRRAELQERSLLPVSAACVVANGIRERLAALCGTSVDLRLWPPAIPKPNAWPTLLQGAQLSTIRGSVCNAAIVLRPSDARSLAALLFGERTSCDTKSRGLSKLEAEITRRAVTHLMTALAPVCGDCKLETGEQAAAFVTYFEMHLLEPIELCMGVALSREPAPTATRAIRPEHLKAAHVDVVVSIPLETRTGLEIAMLRPGETILAAEETAAVLCVGGRVVARGTCGVKGRRYAFTSGSGE
jgi:hypothetical protein